MKKSCNKRSSGMALGTLFAAMHFLWIIAIAGGLARGIARWGHQIHFMNMSYTLISFDIGNAVIGIISAFISGYLIGWAFAWLYNKFN